MTPKIRQTLYGVGTIATAILGILSVWGVVHPAAASTLTTALTGLLTLLGVGAAGTAAAVTHKQRKEGMFDAQSPADVVVTGINAVLQQAEQAQAEVDRVKDAVSAAVATVPILGPLAQQAINRLP